MNRKRVDRLRKYLSENEAILVSSVLNIIYLTNFLGFSDDEREGYLLLTKSKSYVLTDGRYKYAVGKELYDFKLAEITKENNFENNLKEIIKTEKINKLLIDDKDIRVSEYNNIKKNIKAVSDKNLIENLREIKDKTEIFEIKKACKLTDQTFKYILNELREGVTEKQVAQKIIIFILSHNASISFNPIVAFSQNSSSPHHVFGNKKLTKNSIILLDFGVKFNNYCSDMTRTVFFGKATNEQKKMYKTVLESQKKAEAYISTYKNPKTKIADKISRDYIVSKGFPSIPHSLGHGIGLEVHEKPRLSPNSDVDIKEGMVFSIEPGIYLGKKGGVRIEDLYLFKSNGIERITKSTKNIIEL